MRKKLFARAAVLFAAALLCLAGCDQPGGSETEEPAQFTITFESHGGSGVEAVTADENTAVEEPGAPTREGYAFTGWFSSAEGGTEYDWPHTLTGDVTMHARWQENIPSPPPPIEQYTVTFDSHGGSEVEPISSYEGTAVEQPGDPSRENHAFAGWFSAETEGTLYSWPHTLTGDVTMHAQWLENARYTIAFDSHGGSEVPPVTAYEGAAAEQPGDPEREGYGFTGWFSAETEGTLYSWPHVLTGDTTMHAQWRENTLPPPDRYTVAFDSHGGSEVPSVTADAGTALEQPANPSRANYSFTGWFSAASGGTEYPWPHVLTGNTTMHARWRENPRHTIAFDSHGGSAVQSVTDYEGTAVPKPADPSRANHAFAGWFSSAEEGTLYFWPHTLTGDVTMHAQWRENAKHTIVFDSHGGSTVPPVTAYEGTAVPKPADPTRENYSFTGWFSSAEGGAEYEWPHALTGAVIMHARWQENARHTIAFDSHGGSTVPPVTVYGGTAVPQPANPVKANYFFTGWFSSAEGGAKYSWPYTPAADMTMHAQWRDTVKNIAGVPTGGIVGVELDLSIARVLPASAPQTIVWQVKDPGNSGVTAVTDGKFTALKAENQLKLTAVVAGGGANNGDYTQDFTIKIVKPDDFIGVSNIYNVPASGAAGSPLALTGVVQPPSATNTTIVWSLVSAGTTGAVLEGAVLKAQSPGTVTVKAVIEEGLAGGYDYEAEFYITIIANESLSAIPGPGFYAFTGTYDPAVTPSDLRPVADFEEPEDPADFLEEALELVEAGGNYLIVLGRDYVLGPQRLDKAGARVALIGWETERIVESRETNSPLFLVENGTLILGGNIRVINSPGAATARRIQLNGGDLLMHEGAFIGIEDQASNGGAVEVGNGSSFAMHGGGIVNCSAANGGAVNVESGGTFTLAGGTLTGNSATNGGGVYSAGTFAMTGGDISENTATASGGGVYNNGGTFTVSDQWTITGNKLGSSLDAVTSNVNVIPTGTISDQNLPGYGHVFTLAITAPTYSATDGVPIGGSLQIQAALTGLGPYSETITWSAYWIGEGGETPAGSEEVTISTAGLVSVADTVMPGTLKVRAADAENLKSDELELLVKSSRDLRAKFPGDSTLAGSFNAIHAYVTGNAEFGGASSKIQLGDYIDLESLTVVGKQQGTSTTYRGAVTGVSNTEITVDGVPHGRLLRLIVVGINTYRAIDNDGVDGNSNDVPHIVLHFQHLPVTPTSSTNRVPIHWTSGAAPSIGAYSSSVFMYQYLADNFYRGLKNAGIPEGVFWNPARIAGNGSGSATTLLADAAVWLPTAREMFGTAATGDTTETSANQGVFEYYNTDNSTTNAERRKKYRSDNSSGDYILATNMGLTGANRVQFVKVSSSDGTTQSGINGYIATNPSNNNVNYFFAPAFCIGGASAP